MFIHLRIKMILYRLGMKKLACSDAEAAEVAAQARVELRRLMEERADSGLVDGGVRQRG
ncbi:MAG: hypothetical protein V3T90_15280 [Anaerolineae bacterium]